MLAYVNAGTTNLTTRRSPRGQAALLPPRPGPGPRRPSLERRSAGRRRPLVSVPGYSGFRKAGVAIGKDGATTLRRLEHRAAAKQYSEVTLGTVATGGGGPIVRIDRTNLSRRDGCYSSGPTPTQSAISRSTRTGPSPVANSPPLSSPRQVEADRRRETRSEVFRNVSPATYTTDGSYAQATSDLDPDSGVHPHGVGGGDPAVRCPRSRLHPLERAGGDQRVDQRHDFSGATAVTFNGASAASR